MSFPDNTSLSIVPAGGAASSGSKKHAILLRMTPEVLSLLEGTSKSDTQLEVDLGESKGLYINGDFHPFSLGRENSSAAADEIYLRAFHQDKQPSAPLKYYATVSTKYEIGPKLESATQRLRAKQDEIAKQHEQRRTIIIDSPLNLPKQQSKKKKKDQPPAKKPIAPPKSLVVPPKPSTAEPPRTLAVPSSSQPKKAPSPAPRPLINKTVFMPEGFEVARLRIIHCVAALKPTAEQLLAKTTRADSGRAYEDETLKVLETIANPVPDSDPTRWTLKPKMWLEVRPWELKGMDEHRRRRLLKKMANGLDELGISDSHPIWRQLKPPEFAGKGKSSVASSVAAGSSKERVDTNVSARPVKEEGRNGVSSRDVKQKAKATEGRKQAADIIIAKDERTHLSKDRARDAEGSSTAFSQSRHLPGSGYKTKAGSSTPTSATPQNPPSSSQLPVFKKDRLSDGRDGAGERRSMRPESPLPATQTRMRSGSNASATVVKKPRDSEQPPDRKGAESARSVSQKKRKKSPGLDYDSDYTDTDSAVKRRKVDDYARRESKLDRGKGRESEGQPSKSARHVSPPPVRIKKEASPMPPPLRSPLPLNGRGKERQLSASSHDRPVQDRLDRGSSKHRRESVQYTSSEDESDGPESSRDQSRKEWLYDLIDKPPFKPVRPIPQDLRGLGRYYSKVYDIYEVLCSKHRKLKAVLQRRTDDSDARTSDSDDSNLDPDMMPTLVEEYRHVYGELRKILDLNDQLLRKQAYANGHSA